MKAVELLIYEHRLIERMLDVLEDGASMLARGDSVPPKMLAGILEFSQVYADAGHHAKEEDIFFPALAAHGVVPEASAIGAFQAQHQTGRALVRRMREALPDVTAGRTEARGEFGRTALEYIDLLRDHIRLENTLFVEYAQDYLTAAEDHQLRQRMDEVDRARPPAERHDRFARMVAEYEEALSRC